MSGEAQYINPIIQAIIQGNQLALQNRQLSSQVANQQAQQQNAQAELKIRQQQADQAEENIQRQHEYNTGMLDVEHQRAQAQAQEHNLSATLAIPQLIKAGLPHELIASLLGGKMTGSPATEAQPNAPGIAGGIPAQPDTQGIQLPGGQNIPLSSFPTQQSALQDEMNRAQGISGATETGRLTAQAPFVAQSFKNEMTKQQAQQDFLTRQKEAELDWDKTKENLDTKTRLQVAGMENATNKYRTDKEYGITPDQFQSGIYGLATGQIQPNMTNPVDRQMTTGALGAGFRIPQKTDQQSFEALGQMKDVYNKLDDLISQLPSEKDLGPMGATANALGMSAIAHSSLSTDLKNKINELAPQAFNIVKNAQGYTGNRMNSQEMSYVQNGLSNVGTKEQAQDYKQKLQDTIDNRIVNSLEVGMPQTQQHMLYNAYKVTPAWITQAQQTPQAQAQRSKGFVPDVEGSIAKGQLVWDAPQ
jgi:hypothetical protein